MIRIESIPRCPELLIDILYGGLTEYGRQFANREAFDPFLGEAIGRPPRGKRRGVIKVVLRQIMNGVDNVGSQSPALTSH